MCATIEKFRMCESSVMQSLEGAAARGGGIAAGAALV
jgi:hypothetical protein